MSRKHKASDPTADMKNIDGGSIIKRIKLDSMSPATSRQSAVRQDQQIWPARVQRMRWLDDSSSDDDYYYPALNPYEADLSQGPSRQQFGILAQPQPSPDNIDHKYGGRNNRFFK